MDIIQKIQSLTTNAQTLLAAVAKLTAFMGLIRMAYLNYSGRDKGYILEEFLKWVVVVGALTLLPALYDKIVTFFRG